MARLPFTFHVSRFTPAGCKPPQTCYNEDNIRYVEQQASRRRGRRRAARSWGEDAMDQGDANLRGLLQLGIKAAQAKHKNEAYQLLSSVVKRDPNNEQGWLWLAAVAPTPQESLEAFNHVLAINPNNEQAR